MFVYFYEDKGYVGGVKIIQVFYWGFVVIVVDYDFFVKLDVDLYVEFNYFQIIVDYFQVNDCLGLVGGLLFIEKNGEWVYENILDCDYVKGVYKVWCKVVFEVMGGLKYMIGWDIFDEILFQYYGWQVLVDESLLVKYF